VQGLLIGHAWQLRYFRAADRRRLALVHRNRGIALGICATGNYLAGTVWPPVLQHSSTRWAARQTHIWIASFCAATMCRSAWTLRRTTPSRMPQRRIAKWRASRRSALPVAPNVLLTLLVIAGFSCCVAMSDAAGPIFVGYCGDLGYGVAGAPRCCR